MVRLESHWQSPNGLCSTRISLRQTTDRQSQAMQRTPTKPSCQLERRPGGPRHACHCHPCLEFIGSVSELAAPLPEPEQVTLTSMIAQSTAPPGSSHLIGQSISPNFRASTSAAGLFDRRKVSSSLPSSFEVPSSSECSALAQKREGRKRSPGLPPGLGFELSRL